LELGAVPERLSDFGLEQCLAWNELDKSDIIVEVPGKEIWINV